MKRRQRRRLRAIRIEKGLSVAQLANQVGISDSFYYKIERGVRNPTLELAKEISDLLGSSIDDLFFGDQLDDSSQRRQLDRSAV